MQEKRKLSLRIKHGARHAHTSWIIGVKKWARGSLERLFKTTLRLLDISQTPCSRHYEAFSKLSSSRTKDSYAPSSGGAFIYSFCSGLRPARKSFLPVFVRSERCCNVSPQKPETKADQFTWLYRQLYCKTSWHQRSYRRCFLIVSLRSLPSRRE